MTFNDLVMYTNFLTAHRFSSCFTLEGPIRTYLLLVCTFSFGVCIAHAIFQIILAANPPYGSVIVDCKSSNELEIYK